MSRCTPRCWAAENPLDPKNSPGHEMSGGAPTYRRLQVVPAMRVDLQTATSARRPWLSERVLHGEQFTGVKRPLLPTPPQTAP